ncbi:MAG TPA: hypothetical protein VGL81_29625 [Polyangiaceae bacterium]
MTILAIPAITAWRKGALRPLGADVLPALAFYLTMYQAPLRRLVFAGESLTSSEITVLDMALYCSAGVSCIVSLRPGAFVARRATPVPLGDLTIQEARIEAYAGFGAILLGFAFFAIWVASAGLSNVLSASLGDIYLTNAGDGARTTATFQWPLVVGGVGAITHAFARWPGRGPATRLWVPYAIAIVCYAIINARLGARGPTLELFVAIYLIRAETRRPVSRRGLLAFAAAFGFFFFFVSVMRQNLDEGLAGASGEKVSAEAEGTLTGENATEFDVIFDNHVMVTQLAGTKVPYLEGDSWTSVPMQLIPRQIMKNKPTQLSVWFIDYIDHQTARKGGGRAFGSFAEGYLNFGVPGAAAQVVAITMLLLALLPLLRAKAVGVAPAAAALLAFGYHSHRSELLVVAFTTRNAAIVATVTFVIAWILAQILKQPEHDTGAATVS